MDYYPTLEGMCEVVMNDVEDSVYLPTPQFDLQSEHLNYALQQPLGPMVFDYDPYGIPNQPFMNILDPSMNILETRLTPDPPKPKPKTPRVRKPRLKAPVEPWVIKDRDDFLEKLLPKHLTTVVFTKQAFKDGAGSKEEKKFYDPLFSDLKNIEMCRVHCTICDKHIGCGPKGKEMTKTHIMLDVLVCKKCHEFYGDGKFPLDKTDDTEIYCRWCGQGGDQICCSYCPKVFCNKCVKRNFGLEYLKNIQAAADWACFCCAAKPLWPLRAICRALKFYFEKETVDSDKSQCCIKKQKKDSTATPNTKLLSPKPEWTGPNQPFVLIDKLIPQNLNKTPPRAARKSTSASTPLRAKPPPSSQKKVNLVGPVQTVTPPVMPTKPAILGRPKIRPVPLSRLTQPPPPPPPPIPVSRGRGRPRTSHLNVLPKPGLRLPMLPALQPPRPVFNALPRPQHPQEHPTVVIDHNYQKTMAVRIKVPQKPDQFLRIKVVGSCMQVPQFPGPQKRTFVQHCLKQVFRASEMSYHNLMSILGNLENHSENENTEAVLSHLDKWKRVIGALENDVRRNCQTFDPKKTQSNVIDVEEDDQPVNDDEVDGLKWRWVNEASRLEFHDDIEILETPRNNNNKRKAEEVTGPRKRRKTNQEPLMDSSQPGPSHVDSNGLGAVSNGIGDNFHPLVNNLNSSEIDPLSDSVTTSAQVKDPLDNSDTDRICSPAKDPLSDSGGLAELEKDPLEDTESGGTCTSEKDPLPDSGGLTEPEKDPLEDTEVGDTCTSEKDPLPDSPSGGSNVVKDSERDNLMLTAEGDSDEPIVPKVMDTVPLVDIANSDPDPDPIADTSNADLLPDVLNGNVDLSATDPLLADPLSVADFNPLPDTTSCEDSDKIEKLSRVIEEICDSSLAQQGEEPDLMNLLDGDLVLERQND